MAVSALKSGLLPMTQTAMRFTKVAYHDYEGVVLEMDERARLIANLGDCEVMLLRNHGVLALGHTVAQAFNNAYRLERACRSQLMAMACNDPLVLPLAGHRRQDQPPVPAERAPPLRPARVAGDAAPRRPDRRVVQELAPTMRIWHQSLTVLDDVPDYAARIAQHIRRVLRPDTEVVLHGLAPGTYPANYPGDDIGYASLFALHSLQFPVQAINAERAGFDAFAMCTLPDPMLREVRSIVDIPVVGAGEVCFNLAGMLGRRFGMLLFIDQMAPRYLEQIRDYGLAERCIGVVPVGFRFRDVLAGFANPGPLIDKFTAAARSLIAAGADVIIQARSRSTCCSPGRACSASTTCR